MADAPAREPFGHRRLPVVLCRAGQGVPDRRVDPARGDDVDPHRREFERERLGQRLHRAVGGGNHGAASGRAVGGDARGERQRTARSEAGVLGDEQRTDDLDIDRGQRGGRVEAPDRP